MLMAGLLPWAGVASAAAGCSGAESDYNGDGVRDTAIADPEATVGGRADAGSVTVVYGGGAGTVQVHQDRAWVSGTAEAGDRFGHALAQADLNGDGCSDLIVGAPYEAVGEVRDAGAVYVVHGSPEGLGGGAAPTNYNQGQSRVAGSAEAGDLFGYAVAAGRTSSGTPYFAMGVPGEDLGTVRDAGGFFYVRGSSVAWVDQASPGVPGVAEQDDRYGASLAATPVHLAVGSPGEAIGANTFAGGAAVFSHTTDTSGRPTPLTGLDQAAPKVGAAESGDRFGTSLAMAPIPDTSGTYKDGSYLVIGAPGEDLGTAADAGSASVYRVTASGTVAVLVAGLNQSAPGTQEDAQPGDFFGQELAATVQGGTLKVAVGVPGEESSDEHLDKGGVQIFEIAADGTLTDAWLDPGWGIPGMPQQQMFVGTSLAATPDTLLVGVAYGPGEVPGAVHGYEWTVESGGAPSLTHRPGEGGLPAGGKAFGAEVR
ncbi:VCBS repeat-containing protein [Streptomyces sp. SM11]|uniref:VCBS repeat-containing protein n=1 Tax=Streptomyces sp. SM11 TaxID=565557 RepID=UPI002156276C|nr:VCBS repeat-containing protein [Streptomyces sp. SM11]